MLFIHEFLCFCTSSESNTSIKFFVVDTLKPKLCLFQSFFIIKAGLSYLEYYSGALKLQIVILFRQSELLGYKEPEVYLSPNVSSTLSDLKKINDKLNNNLVASCITQILSF